MKFLEIFPSTKLLRSTFRASTIREIFNAVQTTQIKIKPELYELVSEYLAKVTTVESKKSLKKIANFGKVKNAIFSKKMLKIES